MNIFLPFMGTEVTSIILAFAKRTVRDGVHHEAEYNKLAQPGLYFKSILCLLQIHKIEGATSNGTSKLLKKGLASHSPLEANSLNRTSLVPYQLGNS